MLGIEFLIDSLSFRTLNMSSHCLWSPVRWKLVVNIIWNKLLLSCASRILTLAFVSLILMMLSLSLSYLEFLKLMDDWIYSFYQIWAVWVIISLNVLSSPPPPPSETSVVHMLVHQMMPHRLCSFFIILFFFLLLKLYNLNWLSTVEFNSVSRLCPTLCDLMDCSTPGFPVHHQILELTQTHVHQVGDAIQPSRPLSFPSPPAFNLSQHQGLFKWVSSLHQVAKVLEFQLQH